MRPAVSHREVAGALTAAWGNVRTRKDEKNQSTCEGQNADHG